MNTINQIEPRLNEAQDQQTRGNLPQAERLYREVLAADANNRRALENLVMLCLRSGRADQAENHLRQLVQAFPAEPLYCDRLVTLLERRGKTAEAISCYRRLLAGKAELTNSRYNLARLLKRNGHEAEALEQYKECLERNIERPEEVHTNISVVHTEQHRHEAARQSLQAALAHNPAYIPALFNLGLLHEEQGDWPQARALFLKILEQQAYHPDALSHIANGDKIKDPVDPLIRKMKRALRRSEIEDLERENLLYALGKAHDDCRQFSKAFDYYQQANKFSQGRAGRYDRAGQERLVDQLVHSCDRSWFDAIVPVSEAPHIFICGMFRSGSTLMEQILAAHPDITAGGEIDYFQRKLKPLPEAMTAAEPGQLSALGQGYTDFLAQHFPANSRVSNKRPDNFLYLGLIKALFPRARIIHTRRQPLDNCLSLFFQPLDTARAYANDLQDAGHYTLQYRRLMQHWQQLPGADILDVHYEQLVATPAEIIARILEFLKLDWHEGCLKFHAVENRVRTASVHQVRQPLYPGSSGRWQNYAIQLNPLREYLGNAGVIDQS